MCEDEWNTSTTRTHQRSQAGITIAEDDSRFQRLKLFTFENDREVNKRESWRTIRVIHGFVESEQRYVTHAEWPCGLLWSGGAVVTRISGVALSSGSNLSYGICLLTLHFILKSDCSNYKNCCKL